MEIKIETIQFIIDTIDNEFKKDISLKRQEYLIIRKDVNLKKLKVCQELAMKIE